MSVIYGPEDSLPVCPSCQTVLPMEDIAAASADGQGICRECEKCGDEYSITVMFKVEKI